MTLWKRLFGASTNPQLTEDERAVLRRLEDRMDQLERLSERREIEWTGWYDKFRTLFMRIAKRVERAAELEPDAPQSRQDAPETTNDLRLGYGHPPLPTNGQRGPRRNYGG